MSLHDSRFLTRDYPAAIGVECHAVFWKSVEYPDPLFDLPEKAHHERTIRQLRTEGDHRDHPVIVEFLPRRLISSSQRSTTTRLGASGKRKTMMSIPTYECDSGFLSESLPGGSPFRARLNQIPNPIVSRACFKNTSGA